MKKRRLFVGGLPWSVDDTSLKRLFEEGSSSSNVEGCGQNSVEEATVVKERETGKSRGFAFVTMASPEQAAEAARKFNNIEYGGRTLKVDEAADQAGRREGGGFSGRRNNGRGYSN